MWLLYLLKRITLFVQLSCNSLKTKKIRQNQRSPVFLKEYFLKKNNKIHILDDKGHSFDNVRQALNNRLVPHT